MTQPLTGTAAEVVDDPHDHHGQATALTMYLPTRWWGKPFLQVLFAGAKRLAFVTAPLRQNQFIHFARWTLLDEVPVVGGSRRPRRAMLWFESNFDGNLPRYMDTFARALPVRMRAAWGPTEGFPGLFPLSRFHRWTFSHAVPAGHYWSAYPDATTRDVGRALTVDARFEAFLDEIGDGSDVRRFERAWQRFLADVQVDL